MRPRRSFLFRSASFRYLALAGSRLGGPIIRRLSSGWGLAAFLLGISLLLALLVPPGAAASFRAPGVPASSQADKPSSSTAKSVSKAGLLNRIAYVLCADLLILTIWLTLQARQRIVIEPFNDFTGKETDPRTKSIAFLIADHLARMRDLYQLVDQRTAVFARGVDIPVRDASIRTESVNDVIKDAVPADTKFRLGFLDIPFGALLKLLGRLAVGPSITGGLYIEGGRTVLSAQLSGGIQSYSWRVEDDADLTSPTAVRRNIDEMAEELATRIFTDIALDSAVRWKATHYFNAGLQEYRECLRTHQDRKLKLKRAEKAFMRALADDERFEWAYYNLGLVYTGLGQTDSAVSAFLKAIAQDRNRWEGYYALAQLYFEANEEKNHVYVVGLCERVIILNPSTARGHRLLSQALFQAALREARTSPIPDERSKKKLRDLLKRARQAGEEAVANGWLLLCAENWRAPGPNESRIPQKISTVRDCLCDLGEVLLHSGRYEAQSAQGAMYTRALNLFKQAAFLCPDDPDAHVGIGRAQQRLSNFSEAAYCYRYAIRIDSTRTDIWARIWLVSEIMNAEAGPESPARSMGLKPIGEMGEFAQHEFYDRSCDAVTKNLALIREDYEALPLAGRDPFELAAREIETIQRRNDVYAALRRERKIGKEAEDFLLNLTERYKDCNDLCVYAQLAMALQHMERSWDRTAGEIIAILETQVKRSERDQHPALTETSPLLIRILGLLDAEQERLRDDQERCDAMSVDQRKNCVQLAWERAQNLLMQGKIMLAAQMLPKEMGPHMDPAACFSSAIDLLEAQNMHVQIQRQGLRAALANALRGIPHGCAAEPTRILEALEQAQAAVELDPMGAYERSTLGKIYADLSELSEAESASEDARLCNPDAPFYLLEQGIVSLRLARECRDVDNRTRLLTQAASFLTEALTLYTSTEIREKGRTHFTLGHVFRECNAYERAASHFRVAAALGYAPLTAHFCQAWAMLRSGRLDEAVAGFEAVRHKIQAKHPEIEALLAEADTVEKAGKPQAEVKRAEAGKILAGLADAHEETDRPRTLGLILIYSCIGLAFSVLERDALPVDYEVLIASSERLIQAMEAFADPASTRDIRFCRQALADCIGRRFMLDDAAGRLDAAITHFNEAIAFYADPEAYLHLGLAYERKLLEVWDNGWNTDNRRYLRLARTQCGHVQNLDLRREFTTAASSLLARLSELETKPAIKKDAAPDKPET